MSGCDCSIDPKTDQQKKVLFTLLLINAVMFVVELVLGIYSQSTALIADSMDMLADAIVYSLGLYAVGKTTMAKIRAASVSGVFQIMLGCFVLVDVFRRFVMGSEPESSIMILVGLLALLANISCLKLLSKHREGEVHMRASWVFSKNDVIANLGVLLAAVLVFSLESRLPDLLIGMMISIVVIHGGIHIVKDARREKQNELVNTLKK